MFTLEEINEVLNKSAEECIKEDAEGVKKAEGPDNLAVLFLMSTTKSMAMAELFNKAMEEFSKREAIKQEECHKSKVDSINNIKMEENE